MARPPIYGTNEELEALGKEMLQWIEDKEDDEKIVHLSQFYIKVKDMCRSEWRSIRQRAAFLPYYEKALELLGCKMITNSKLPQSYGNRFLPVYFSDVRESEREIAKEKVQDEIDIKKAEMKSISDEAIDFNKAVVDSIKSLQKITALKKTEQNVIDAEQV